MVVLRRSPAEGPALGPPAALWIAAGLLLGLAGGALAGLLRAPRGGRA